VRPKDLYRPSDAQVCDPSPPGLRSTVCDAFDNLADGKTLTRLEMGVLMSVAYLQLVTRGGIWKFFARDSQDMIVAPQDEGADRDVSAAARQVDISL
jgi:hypothetical protein